MVYPATQSALTTPFLSAIFWVSASSVQLRLLVSAEMVTMARPPVGIDWLMVSIFAPQLAKIATVSYTHLTLPTTVLV